MNEVARNKYECQAWFSWRIALEQLPSFMWNWEEANTSVCHLSFPTRWRCCSSLKLPTVWVLQCKRRFYWHSPFLFRSIALFLLLVCGHLFPLNGAIKTKEDQIRTSSSKGQEGKGQPLGLCWDGGFLVLQYPNTWSLPSSCIPSYVWLLRTSLLWPFLICINICLQWPFSSLRFRFVFVTPARYSL